MEFEMPKDQSSIIKVIGVGGGGSNAVNYMYAQGITGVDFIICNTDAQALETSAIPNKIQLGTTLTEGLGAGANPEVGKNSAIEDVEEIRAILQNGTKMLFVTAGMGGGTGTGAAPVIAEVAKEMGILTVGIVTIPFSFEGRKRRQQAEAGINELRKHVDTMLVVNNDKLREMYGNLKMSEAFSRADDVLAVAAKSIAEIITVTGYINVDFKDVETVMMNGGTALMGSAKAEGENRAIKAVSEALSSPLLNDNEIEGANYILVNMTFGDDELTMDEQEEITDYIQQAAGNDADIISGFGHDAGLGDQICVTVIATGFRQGEDGVSVSKREEKKVVRTLDEEVVTSATQTVQEKEVSEEVDEVPPVNQASLDFAPIQQVNPEEEVKEGGLNVVTFDLNDDVEEIEKKRDSFQERKVVDESADDEAETEAKEQELTSEELAQRAKERLMNIRKSTQMLKNPSSFSNQEKLPAYQRKNIKLDDTPHSSEQSVSRFTLSDEGGEMKLKDNNSFLHDNVD